MPKITIADLAAEAGVSISTASKALNGTGSISPDTVRRIENAANRIGYRPNRAAQLLAGKNKNIGIIVPKNPEEVMQPIIGGLTETLDEYSEYGFKYTIRTLDLFGDTTSDFSSCFSELCKTVNGIIFVPMGDDGIRRQIIGGAKIPKVSLQIAAEPEICPGVTVDEEMVGKMAAEFLALSGNIANTALIVGNRRADIHRRNIEGFTAEAKARGLSVLDILDSYDQIDKAKSLTLQLCERFPELDGIFVSSYVSPGVCAALIDNGLAGKIRVIGVDVYDKTAEYLRQGVLSAIIYQNQREQARRAVTELISLMRDGTARRVRIKPELVLQSNLPFYIN